MTIRGVIFDLGGTLVSYHPNKERAGAEAARDLLIGQGYPLPPIETLYALNHEMFDGHIQRILDGDTANLRIRPFLIAFLKQIGVPETDLGGGLVEAVQAVYFERFRATLDPLAGATDTLAALRRRNLRVGLVSNSLWSVEQFSPELERWGYMPYLECVLFSSDAGLWKPNPALFHRALTALDLTPAETVYVGDSLYFDIYGAQQAGLRGILVGNNDWEPPEWHSEPIVPAATVSHLSDILPVIESWTG